MVKMVTVSLDAKQLKALKRARDILDEVVETLEITSDPEMLRAIREGEEDIKAGRVRPFEKVIEEAGLGTRKARYRRAPNRK